MILYPIIGACLSPLVCYFTLKYANQPEYAGDGMEPFAYILAALAMFITVFVWPLWILAGCIWWIDQMSHRGAAQ